MNTQFQFSHQFYQFISFFSLSLNKARNYIEEIKANRGAKIAVDVIDEAAVTFDVRLCNKKDNNNARKVI